jgi:hypothetical protein
MCGVMAMVTLLLGLGMALLLTVMRADQVASATLRDLSRHGELADQFRADVARADAAPDRLGDLTASPECLILRTNTEHVIYRWHGEKLDRTVRGDGPETNRPVALSKENMAVEFVRTAGGRPMITVRVTESIPRAAPRVTEIAAALGGDMR